MTDAVKRAVRDALENGGRFVVLEHIKPDGDCVGSGLALVMALRSLGKQAVLLSHDPHPKAYDFLPGSEFHRLARSYVPDFAPDAAIFVDCAGPDRVGDALNHVGEGKWINIDHHVSNTQFGALNWVEPKAAATGELVFELIRDLGVMTFDTALCLYVAILTDTGGFRYANTTARTFKVASSLVEQGVDPGDVASKLFERRSPSSLLLMGHSLTTLKLYQEGRLATVVVTRDVMEACGGTLEDTEGLVVYPRSVEGVEVALLFTETVDGTVRVSFRSTKGLDVAQIASVYGGGGHFAAAGAVVKGRIDDVYRKVLETTLSYMT